MISPARRHFLKASATASAVASATPETNDQYQLMLAALIEDRRRLHDIQSIERKIEAKKVFIQQYEPYVDGVLESGAGAQDDVVVTMLVWNLDIGNIPRALAIANYALKHKLTPPDSYRRATASILVEEAADHYLRGKIKLEWESGAIKNQVDDGSFSNEIALLLEIDKVTAVHDMHDQIRAKLYKAVGYLQSLQGDYADARLSLERALNLNQNIGVKKDIERLLRLIG